jgi:hypothetical protein
MTREEIEKLEGWELAAAVAEHVMGECPHVLTADARPGTGERSFKCSRCGQTGFDYLTDFEGRLLCAPYYIDPAAALRVAESWQYNFVISRDMGLCGDMETAGTKKWRVVLCAPGMEMAGIEADTLPRAICIAALLAVFATPAPAAARGAK